MASTVQFVQWRLSYLCVFFIILHGLCINIASTYDVKYYSYDVLHPLQDVETTVELKDKRITKRSVLHLQPQPAWRTVRETNQSLDSPSVNSDVEVSKASNLSTATSSKTGGNYLSDNSTVLPDGRPDSYLNNKTSSSPAKPDKWTGKSGKKVNEEAAEMVGSGAASSPVEPVLAAGDNSTAKTSENSKGDGSKPPKKAESETKPPPTKAPAVDDKAGGKKSAESETKPPKPAPTKSPIGEDKAAKKSAAEEKAARLPTPSPPAVSTTQSLEDPDDELCFPHDVSNKTLVQNNITLSNEDTHQYYNSSFIVNNAAVGLAHWINMSDRHDVQVNELLSQSHRRAATVRLSFDFPFYGHMVRNLTVATGGFLYTGDYVHSWLAATQYIAPLMANFDTSLSNDSYVKYLDNGTAFTVQWEKVVLQDKPAEGDFTFQVTLHSNGDIVFVYQKVPTVIENILDDHHPVKVGLSDAYIIDRTIFFVRRKTIYEYHRVNFDRQDIKNWTVIYLNALPTCLDVKDCTECLSRATVFSCNWCPGSNRCSNGMDRYRQEWLQKGCDRYSINSTAQCPIGQDSAQHNEDVAHAHTDKHSLSERVDSNSSMGASGIVGVLLLVVLVGGLAFWILYGYRNPHTASGQLLIRYRPSTWSWRRGEARYTAATIHM